MGVLVVLVTASSQEEAFLIGRRVVQNKLAACVTIVPKVVSIFEWEGNVCEEHEWLLVIKSNADVYDALEAEVKALHSYEVPEILALSVAKGSSEYLSWVKAMTMYLGSLSTVLIQFSG